jgi:cytochrome c-type biogenesis protein
LRRSTLGAILSAAALTNSAPHAALLLAFYSAGLAVPFLLSSLAFARMSRAFGPIKRHYGTVMAFGGIVLIAMGVLIWTGERFQLNIEAQRLLDRAGLNFFNDV